MNRREALTATAALFGGTIAGASFFLNGCTTASKKSTALGAEDISLLDHIAEIILPATADSPGALAAKVGSFMKTMVADCYTDQQQDVFLNGLSQFRSICLEGYGKQFEAFSLQQQQTFINQLDQEAWTYEQTRKNEEPQHYFTLIKQLTILGYFTSEPGVTQCLRWIPIPGSYDGCVDYHGEPAWA